MLFFMLVASAISTHVAYEQSSTAIQQIEASKLYVPELELQSPHSVGNEG
jgi:hypothetical protein